MLLPFAGDIASAGQRARGRLSAEVLEAILASVPDLWLSAGYGDESVPQVRDTLLRYLLVRLDAARVFEEEADRARALLV